MMLDFFLFLMIRRPPRSTRTDTRLPYSTLFRSPGDPLYLGRKPTGTLVADALLPGRRLFLLSTGTGLAPFLTLAPVHAIYERFTAIVLVHCVRQVAARAWRDDMDSQLSGHPLVQRPVPLSLHTASRRSGNQENATGCYS